MRFPLVLLLLAATPALAQESYDPSLDPRRYDGCVRAIAADAARVEKYATEWLALGGGVPARHCLALAQLHEGKNAAAGETLAAAARLAEAEKNPFAADLWGQAGNAALLAGDAAQGEERFTAALAVVGEFAPERTANLLVDRARARVEEGKLAEARTDLDRALGKDAELAEGWLLSAALARRENDLPRAENDIGRAVALAPGNADMLLEKGNIAAAAGRLDEARQAWQQAAGGSGDAARLAAEALAGNP